MKLCIGGTMKLNDAPRNRYFKIIDEQHYLFKAIGYATWLNEKKVFIAISGRLGIGCEMNNPDIEMLDTVTLIHTTPVITEETKIQ